MPAEVRTVLATYCVDCHGAKGRGQVRLTNLESLKLNERLDLLNRVQPDPGLARFGIDQSGAIKQFLA